MPDMIDWVRVFEDPHHTQIAHRSTIDSDATQVLPLRHDRLGDNPVGGWVHAMSRRPGTVGPRRWTTRYEASRDTLDELHLWWVRNHFWSVPRRIEIIWHLETVSSAKVIIEQC